MNWHLTKEHDPYALHVDVTGLQHELERTVKGEVRFDAGSRGMYAQDAGNYRHIPYGVVLPTCVEDVLATIAACREFGAPLVSRGGGTGLCGQACSVGIVMDHSKYFNRILEINAEEGYARVQPGVVLDELRDAAEQHHLTFGPDPATHTHCTLGGMLGNNSCGVHSIMAGRTADNVIELDVVTYDGVRMKVGPTTEEELQRMASRPDRVGEIYRTLKDIRDHHGAEIRKRFPNIPRLVSGYALDQLLPENGFQLARALVGTESTCVTILEAKVKLVKSPPVRTLLVLGYPDVYEAGDHVPEVLACGPVGLEGIDDQLVKFMKIKDLHVEYIHLLPEGKGWLLVEFGGETKEEAEGKAKACMAALKLKPDAPTMHLYDNKEAENEIWKLRESGLGATADVPGMPYGGPGWEDAAVEPRNVGKYLRDFRDLLNKFGYQAALYGHFGDGCIHCRISFDLFNKPGVDNYMSFLKEATKLVLRYGGSLSGEHGDGQSKASFLPEMYGEELCEQFRRFKRVFDPEWKMNPGKVVDPWRPDEHLRMGPDYEPKVPKSNLAYPADHGTFTRATIRCVGVGECRRKKDAFMCPSFLVTHEERDSTRGRARLLNEMVRGDLIKDGWRSKEVAQGLDLCLGCKGCKKECPVNVDMATYKAEFLSHQPWWSKPREAYAMGFIGRAGRVAAMMPGVANWFTHAPVLASLAKAAAGVSPHREFPRFAKRTFRSWFKSHRSKVPDKAPEVVLFPDAFNDRFMPDTLQACVEVLEHWGFRVIVPMKWMASLRPLIHYGWLKIAKKQAKRTLQLLEPYLQQGIPIVAAEPSVVSVFRDELGALLPGDRDAMRLAKQSWLLSEFIMDRQLPLPTLPAKVVFHGHCHQKAVLKVNDMRSMMKAMGVTFEEPQAGCCGMAGSFGFEKRHYDISMKIAELGLLPHVRKAAEETLIVADGFSCRTQIEEGTHRKALHSAQFLRLAFAANAAQRQPQQQPNA